MHADLTALLEPRTDDRPSPATPAAALARLLAGNRRFAEGRIESPRRALARMRRLAEQQAPFAAVVTCSDTRVPSELVFDQGYGDLHVTCVPGNVVTPEAVASIEFAVAELGVQVVYVLGHTFCSTIAAMAGRDAARADLTALADHLVPALEAAGGSLPAAVERNARWQAELLVRRSSIVATALEAGTVTIAAGVLDLVSGVIAPITLELPLPHAFEAA